MAILFIVLVVCGFIFTVSVFILNPDRVCFIVLGCFQSNANFCQQRVHLTFDIPIAPVKKNSHEK